MVPALLGLGPGDRLADAQCEPAWSTGFAGAGADGQVSTMIVFDDGRGPALFVGGSFTNVGGAAHAGIARFDGVDWESVGGGMNAAVATLTVFDGGTGPFLFAAGAFTLAGGQPANRVARWDGTRWWSLGDGLNGPAYALEVFDDGTGPGLYVGGNFSLSGGEDAKYIARWRAGAWSGVGDGAAFPIRTMRTFDDGSGAALYIGGPGSPRRWDGAQWSLVAAGMSAGEVNAFAGFDDGGGAALLAGGRFALIQPGSPRNIARWDGTMWHSVGGGVSSPTSPYADVFALGTFEGGVDAALLVGGRFTQAGNLSTGRIARWDGLNWSALAGGIGEDAVHAMARFEDRMGPAMYVGGVFSSANGHAASNLARWGCPPSAGDCNLDASTDHRDFTNFCRCLGGVPSGSQPGCDCGDFDADLDVDLLDFQAFQNAFDHGH